MARNSKDDIESILKKYEKDKECRFVFNESSKKLAKRVEKVKKEVEELLESQRPLIPEAIIKMDIERLSNLKDFVDSFQKSLIQKEQSESNIDEKQNLVDSIVDLSFLENQMLSYIVQYNTAKYNDLLDGVSEKSIKKFEQEITETEKRTTNHAMTFMSVLAALIAIITSVITTSSTWLNNANQKEAILAFTLPSLVIVVAVTLLLAFCGFLYPGGKKRQITSIVIFLCVTVFIIAFSFVVLPPIMNGV